MSSESPLRTDSAVAAGLSSAPAHTQLTAQSERGVTANPLGVIARNMIALLGSQVASWAVTTVLLVVLPQYLGDTHYGQLNIAGSLAAFFALFLGFGGTQFIVKEIARDSSRVGVYVFNAIALNLALAVPVSALAIGTAYLLAYSAQTCTIVAIVCMGMVLATVNSTLAAGLQGQQRMTGPAIWAAVDRYLSGVAVVVAIVLHSGLLLIATALFLASWASFFGNGVQIFRQLTRAAHLDLRLWKVLALGGMPFMLWSLVLMVYGSVDTIMLSKMTGEAVVGWYALAYRLVGMPVFLASIVVTATFPQLSALRSSTSASFRALVNRSLRLVFFVSAPVTAGLALVASSLIAFMHYPAPFSHSVVLIQILALHIPFVGLTMVLGTALNASDRQRQWIIIGVIASVFNPAANLFAIPATSKAFGNGAVGASIVTVATEFVMLSGGLYLLRRDDVPDRQTLGYVARCIVACAAMTVAVLATGQAWLPLRAPAGALTYGLASLALGTLPAAQFVRHSVEVFALVRRRIVPANP